MNAIDRLQQRCGSNRDALGALCASADCVTEFRAVQHHCAVGLSVQPAIE